MASPSPEGNSSVTGKRFALSTVWATEQRIPLRMKAIKDSLSIYKQKGHWKWDFPQI
jgi:hypothetical protein